MTAMQIGQLLSQHSPGQTDDPNPRPSMELQPGSLELVEKVFERFALHYGAARMASHWFGLDPDKAKAYWSRKLDRMPRRNLIYGMQYLPEKPPSVEEFLAICRRCPPEPVSGLLAHKPTPEEIARTKAKGLEVIRQYRQRLTSDPEA
jgi:hypothetical protein